MPDTNPFDRLARYYDWEHASYDADIALYQDFARRTGGPILEVACGTGRLIGPLLETGERIVGIDSSAQMLAVARRTLGREGRRGGVVLHQADVRTFRLDERFRLAIFALDSFGLLLDVRDQLAALGRIREHLEPDGVLIVDVSNGNGRGVESPDEIVLQHAGPDPVTGHLLSKWTARSTDVAEQLDRYTYFYDEVDDDGVVRRTTTELALRYFGRFEFELLLERAGFLVEALYGSYDLAPFTVGSERLIAVAVRVSR
ncbi:MAG: class I SAM-dependent methyltransferase [Chloroflexi bacterium]|nr:class I SAM-dependent methyltransferase [Chloroflexota bacterium]